VKRVLKSLALGLAIYVIYLIVAGTLILYYIDGDLSRIRSAPPFDIASRLPTIIFRYLFPEQLEKFYKPEFTNGKLLLGSASFLMNVFIFSIPPYLFFWSRERFKKIDTEPEDAPPPPPPSFD